MAVASSITRLAAGQEFVTILPFPVRKIVSDCRGAGSQGEIEDSQNKGPGRDIPSSRASCERRFRPMPLDFLIGPQLRTEKSCVCRPEARGSRALGASRAGRKLSDACPNGALESDEFGLLAVYRPTLRRDAHSAPAYKPPARTAIRQSGALAGSGVVSLSAVITP